MRERMETVIVGAGITGLALSRTLAARGHAHTVLEASDRPGGAIRTRLAEGRVLEEGPQRTRATPALTRLIDTLGIAGEVVAAPADLPLYVYARERLRAVPFSFGALARTDLFGPRGKARLLLEPFTAPLRSGESVRDYFVRRFGERAYTDLLGPLFGGLYASDPAQMPARYALEPALRQLGAQRSAILALLRPRTPARTPAISFRRGLSTLTDALHAGVRSHVRLATPARAIACAADGFTIETDSSVIDARNIVITAPAGAAAALLAGIAPEAAARLDSLCYNRVVLVHLEGRESLAGLGYQVAFGERLRTRGVTFNHSLFARPNLYTAFLGGAHDPSLFELDDTRIAALAADELETVLGVRAAPINVAHAQVPAWDDSWDALAGLELPPRVHLAANYESRIGLPGRLARAAAMADRLLADA